MKRVYVNFQKYACFDCRKVFKCTSEKTDVFTEEVITISAGREMLLDVDDTRTIGLTAVSAATSLSQMWKGRKGRRHCVHGAFKK